MPLDERAAAAVRTRGGSPLAVWLAGVTGDEHPGVRARVVVVGAGAPAVPVAGVDVVVAEAGPQAAATLTTPEVAAGVDAGRELAAAAAGDGIAVLAGVSAAPADALASWLTGGAPGPEIRGPLGALRRLGGGELTVLTGLALGAGERGLGYVCEGLAASAAAGVAVAVEPDLRPRLLAGRPSAQPLHGALLERLGLAPAGGDVLAALAGSL
ncbi:MAG TPA: nicotinate-nucleotide--dimethylbenzimidazole phosphoribosyltransferase [Solirubrobacteraceae bacterium]